MSDRIYIEQYSEKSIVVRGDTKQYKEQLKELGGKWNSRLKDGAGWVFSKHNEKKVTELVSSLETSNQVENKTSEKDFIKQLSILFKDMNVKDRLRFISTVSQLATSVAYREKEEEKVSVVDEEKDKEKEDEEVDIEDEDEEDEEDEEEEKPLKRMLKPSKSPPNKPPNKPPSKPLKTKS